MYSVIFVNDIVLTEGLYLVPYQWESEHILNVFCHSGNIRKAINVFNSKCFIQVQRLPKFWEREREARKNYQWKYICELSWGKHCKFCTTEIRMFCKLIYQSFMSSAFLLLYFKWLIFFWQFLVLGFAEEPFLLRCIMYVLHEAICHKTFKGNTVFVVYFKS